MTLPAGAAGQSLAAARAVAARPARATVPRPTRAFPLAAGLAAAALAVVAAGCGSTAAGPASAPAGAAPPPTTSLTVPGGPSWAVVEMGGSRAEHNNFWQLVIRPAGAARWALATPPGVADNGGLVAASLGGQALVAGFNPSQDLKFSPLATTYNGGARWAPSLLTAGLASVPSALAAGPGGRLIALTSGGQAEMSAPGGAGWRRLASLPSLAATAAGGTCGLSRLTAAAFSPSGAPLLAGRCARPGVAGIFAYAGGGWHPAGPALPAALARSRISVFQLTSAGRGTTALLTAVAPGGTASLVAAWAGSSGRWELSVPLPLRGSRILATATGPASVADPATAAVRPGLPSSAGVILSGGRAEYIPGPAGTWQRLPALPAHAAALVLGPGGQVSALAASGSILTGWRLAVRSAGHAVTWTRTQTMRVPVPYGSSG
jgi:hypothetical protein